MRYLRVAVDRGHNCAPDTGAVANGCRECDIVDRVGRKLIELMGTSPLTPVEVNPGRCTTVSGSLATRVRLANDAGVGLYLSLHCNAFANPNVKGTEVFYFQDTESFAPELAKALSSEISKVLKTNNRGAKPGNFYVLRETKAPAVLVELGFITNKNEAKALEDNIDKLAEAIHNVLVEFSCYKPIELSLEKAGVPTVVPESVYGEEIDYSIVCRQLKSDEDGGVADVSNADN